MLQHSCIDQQKIEIKNVWGWSHDVLVPTVVETTIRRYCELYWIRPGDL